MQTVAMQRVFAPKVAASRPGRGSLKVQAYKVGFTPTIALPPPREAHPRSRLPGSRAQRALCRPLPASEAGGRLLKRSTAGRQHRASPPCSAHALSCCLPARRRSPCVTWARTPRRWWSAAPTSTVSVPGRASLLARRRRCKQRQQGRGALLWAPASAASLALLGSAPLLNQPAAAHVCCSSLWAPPAVLDAADSSRIDMPASCRGGVCGSCVSKLVSGEIDNSWQCELDDGNVLSAEQMKVRRQRGRRPAGLLWAGGQGASRLVMTWRGCCPALATLASERSCETPALPSDRHLPQAGWILPCSTKPKSDLVIEYCNGWGIQVCVACPARMPFPSAHLSCCCHSASPRCSLAHPAEHCRFAGAPYATPSLLLPHEMPSESPAPPPCRPCRSLRAGTRARARAWS